MNPNEPTLPPLRIPKLTKRPRYDGPFKLINIDLNEPMNFMQEQMFLNAPCNEPMKVSTRRLCEALRADGEAEIRPMTIWLCYRLHPELSMPLAS